MQKLYVSTLWWFHMMCLYIGALCSIVVYCIVDHCRVLLWIIVVYCYILWCIVKYYSACFVLCCDVYIMMCCGVFIVMWCDMVLKIINVRNSILSLRISLLNFEVKYISIKTKLNDLHRFRNDICLYSIMAIKYRKSCLCLSRRFENLITCMGCLVSET